MQNIQTRLRELEQKVAQQENLLRSYGLSVRSTKGVTKFAEAHDLLMQFRTSTLVAAQAHKSLTKLVAKEGLAEVVNSILNSLPEWERTTLTSDFWPSVNNARDTFLQIQKDPSEHLFSSPEEILKTVKSPAQTPKTPSTPVGVVEVPGESVQNLFPSTSTEEQTPKKVSSTQKKPTKRKKEKEKKKKKDSKESKQEELSSPKKGKKIHLTKKPDGSFLLDEKPVDLEQLLRFYRIPFKPSEVADKERQDQLEQKNTTGTASQEDADSLRFPQELLLPRESMEQ